MSEKKLEIVAEPGKPTIYTRRTVDAPRRLVYDAFTKPEHLRRWMGPCFLKMTTCEVDLRVGGQWRFVYSGPNGESFGFHGEFRELLAPERIVRTFVFEAFPDAEALETLELVEEKGGRTTIRTTTLHASVENRDGHLNHGMEQGMTEGYAQLDDLLGQLQGGPATGAAASA